MKKIWASLLIVGAVLVGAVWLVDSIETFESHYETYQALIESESTSHGWVSHVIPKSSYDIFEIHRVSGGIVTVRFRFQPGDTKDIESRCAGLTTNDPMITPYRCLHDGVPVIVRLEGTGQGQVQID
jgi:hypothetical protein